MRDFPPAPKRGNYKLLERMHIKDTIYGMLVEGHSFTKIQKDLNISERTFYRYYQIIESDELEFLSEERSREQMRLQFRLCRDRLLEDRLQIKQWLKDDPKAKDRAELMNLSAELSAAIARLYDEGPSVLVQRHTFKGNPLVDPGSTGLRLILNKKRREVQELEEGLGTAGEASAAQEERQKR